MIHRLEFAQRGHRLFRDNRSQLHSQFSVWTSPERGLSAGESSDAPWQVLDETGIPEGAG